MTALGAAYSMVFNIVTALVAVAVVGGGLFLVRRMQGGGGFAAGGQKGVQDLQNAMTQRLGYVTQPDATPDPASAMRAGQPTITHMVRQVSGWPVHWYSRTHYHVLSVQRIRLQ